MTPPGATLAIRASAFAAAAVLCALVSNTLAGPARRLAWGAPPPAAAPVLPQAPPATPPPLDRPVAPEPLPAPPREPLRPASPRPGSQPAPAREDRFKADPDAVVREIGSRDAWNAYGLHIPFLDARRSAEFAEGHVAGAWSVPVWEDGADAAFTTFEARKGPRPKDPIVLYCSGGGCEDSRILANKLVGLGYRNLLIYAGGYPDWTGQARPVEHGAPR